MMNKILNTTARKKIFAKEVFLEVLWVVALQVGFLFFFPGSILIKFLIIFLVLFIFYCLALLYYVLSLKVTIKLKGLKYDHINEMDIEEFRAFLKLHL